MSIECRSALFMPASNERALAKGPALTADVIIIDLEDSVAPGNKAMARSQAVRAFQQLDYGYRLKALRINAADTPWHTDDIAAAAQCQPDAIVIPKVDTVDDIAAVSLAMDQHAQLGNTAIWAMMESPLAVINAVSITASVTRYPRLSLLIIGNNDMAQAAGMPVQSDRTYLVPWLMQLVAAAKAHGLQILDSVYNDFADMDGFSAECRQGASMGMNGKTLIHPSQLAVANTVFAPSDIDVANAREIVSEFAKPEHDGKGAIAINGRMIERLHLTMAEQLLARVDRLRART